MFEVMAVGVGDTFSARNHTTALVLTCDGFQLAIDCPDTYRRVLQDAANRSGRGLELEDIDHLLITHVHGDHMNGLEGVAFYKHFVEGKRVKLLTTPEVSDVIWRERLRVSMGQLWSGEKFRTLEREDYFEDLALNWSKPVEVGPFRIETYRTVHHVPTCAVRIQAGSQILGYSSDTAFDPGLIEFLSTADLIIHETNFGPAHTPYERLAELPEKLRKKMRIIHYPDFLDLEESVIQPMIEGQYLEVADTAG